MALKIYFCDTRETLVTWQAGLLRDGVPILYITPFPGPDSGDIVRLKVAGGLAAVVTSKKTIENADGQFVIVTNE